MQVSAEARPSAQQKRGRVGCLAALLAGPLAALAYLCVPGWMSGDALVTSLERQDRVNHAACYSADVTGKRECVVFSAGEPPGDEYVDSYAPSERYDVVVRGRCWTARRTHASDVQPPMPTKMSACIVVGDHIRLLYRLPYGGDPNDHFERGPDHADYG